MNAMERVEFSGDLLRTAREQMGWNVQQAARRVGVSKDTWWSLEREAHLSPPGKRVRKAIEGFLGMAIEWPVRTTKPKVWGKWRAEQVRKTAKTYLKGNHPDVQADHREGHLAGVRAVAAILSLFVWAVLAVAPAAGESGTIRLAWEYGPLPGGNTNGWDAHSFGLYRTEAETASTNRFVVAGPTNRVADILIPTVGYIYRFQATALYSGTNESGRSNTFEYESRMPIPRVAVTGNVLYASVAPRTTMPGVSPVLHYAVDGLDPWDQTVVEGAIIRTALRPQALLYTGPVALASGEVRVQAHRLGSYPSRVALTNIVEAPPPPPPPATNSPRNVRVIGTLQDDGTVFWGWED